MAVDVTTPKTADQPVQPRNAQGKLLELSAERWREQSETAKGINLAGPYMEALCLLQLAMMENDTLKKLRLFARAHVALDNVAGQLEAFALTIKQMGELVATKTMPELMDQAEVEDFSLTSGFQVEIKEKVHASLAKENMAEGCAILEKTGFSALVKRTVTVPFSTKQGKIADKVVKAIAKALGEEQVEVTDKREVHHSTLSAWVRNQLKEGKPFSTEQMKLFGVFRQRRAVITEKKSD